MCTELLPTVETESVITIYWTKKSASTKWTGLSYSVLTQIWRCIVGVKDLIPRRNPKRNGAISFSWQPTKINSLETRKNHMCYFQVIKVYIRRHRIASLFSIVLFFFLISTFCITIIFCCIFTSFLILRFPFLAFSCWSAHSDAIYVFLENTAVGNVFLDTAPKT